MNTEPKTMFGWDMDKDLDFFARFASNLPALGMQGKADAIYYLIERCKIAEAKVKELEWKVDFLKLWCDDEGLPYGDLDEQYRMEKFPEEQNHREDVDHW